MHYREVYSNGDANRTESELIVEAKDKIACRKADLREDWCAESVRGGTMRHGSMTLEIFYDAVFTEIIGVWKTLEEENT